VGWLVLCVGGKEFSADLNHLGHLPYQLLKTVYKLPSSREKGEAQKSIWLFIDIRCCKTKCREEIFARKNSMFN
jgi:hypothetical protein